MGRTGSRLLGLVAVALVAAAPRALAQSARGERTPLVFTLVPFGVGQFANEQPGKGALFLGVEAAAFVTFGVSLALLETKKQSGTFLREGVFAPEDYEAARALNVVQVAAFWTGVAVAAAGVVDALLNRDGAPSSARVSAGPGSLVVRW